MSGCLFLWQQQIMDVQIIIRKIRFALTCIFCMNCCSPWYFVAVLYRLIRLYKKILFNEKNEYQNVFQFNCNYALIWWNSFFKLNVNQFNYYHYFFSRMHNNYTDWYFIILFGWPWIFKKSYQLFWWVLDNCTHQNNWYDFLNIQWKFTNF